MIGTFGWSRLTSRATSDEDTPSNPPSSTMPLTPGNLVKISSASLPLYAVRTLNLAVSMTSLRVEMLPGNSRSITRKHGLFIQSIRHEKPHFARLDRLKSSCRSCAGCDPYSREPGAGSPAQLDLHSPDSMPPRGP